MPRFEKRGFIKVHDLVGDTVEQIPLSGPEQIDLPGVPEEGSESARNRWRMPEELLVQAEDAAELLIQFLPKETQELIEEARRMRGVPLWQMLLGYVMRYAERYELFSPVILSSWEFGERPDAPHKCRACGGFFQSRFSGAAFCCNSCACGKVTEKGHTDGCVVTVEAAHRG